MVNRTARDEWRQVLDSDPCMWFLYEGSTPSQRKALFAEEHFMLLEGGNFSGKTATLAVDVAAYARGIHPARPDHLMQRGLIVTADRDDWKLTWGDRFLTASRLKGKHFNHPLIPPDEIEDVSYVRTKAGPKTPNWITLQNGFGIGFHRSGEAASWKSVAGKEWDFVVWDESVGTLEEYEELVYRLRTSISASLDAQRRGPGWMAWGCTEIAFNQALRQYRAICEDEGNDYAAKYILESAENPAVNEKTRDLLAGAVDKEVGRARSYGEGSVLDTHLIYGRQWDRRRHVIRNYRIRDTDSLYGMIDPGTDNPFGVMVAAMSADEPHQGKMLAYASWRMGGYAEPLKWLASWLRGRRLEAIIYDPAAHQTDLAKDAAIPLIDLLVEYGEKIGLSPYSGWWPGHNPVKAGIDLVRGWLDPDPDDSDATPMLVFDEAGVGMEVAIAEMVGYQFNPTTGKPITGKGRTTCDTCPDLVRYFCSLYPEWQARSPNRIVEPTMRDYLEGRAQVDPQTDPELAAHVERVRDGAKAVERYLLDSGDEEAIRELHTPRPQRIPGFDD